MPTQVYTVPSFIEDAPTDEQAAFYRKTYLTAGISFVVWMFAVRFLYFTDTAQDLLSALGYVSWLVVLGIFWVTSFIGQKLQFSDEPWLQYLGLGIYIAAYTVIFLPLIDYVVEYSDGWYYAMENVFKPAFVATGTIFGALTTIALLTKADFSFLKSFVVFGSFFAIGAIIIFSITGMHVSSLFSIAMIVLMSGTILYETHQIKNEFDTTQHIGAGAALFASFMVLLWYVIRLFISRDD
jgi:FtsH-binding integral membrane protein